ncbi:MAG TPA: metallophosphoesterase [archaeon]|nr:metallophosphoesterase [archaeon]
MLRFITNEPALVFNKTLVVADLHIGIEHELYKSGIKVPTQIEKLRSKIDSLVKQTKTKRIIFLGDIKHQVPGVSFQELREVPEFFNYFSNKIETHIVLGNHDSEIGALVENVKIHDTPGFKLEDVYIAHGHANIKKEFLKCKYLILSHTHPLIEIRDKLGYRFVQLVWVRAVFDKKKVQKKYGKVSSMPEIILMPAFNPLSGGVAINSKEKDAFTGPLTKLINKKQAEVFFLDGTCLGKLKDL